MVEIFFDKFAQRNGTQFTTGTSATEISLQNCRLKVHRNSEGTRDSMFNDIPICFQRSGNGNTVFSTPSNPRFQRNNQRILSIETALPVLAPRWIRCQLNFEKRSRLLILSGVPFQGTCISVIHLQQLHSSRAHIHPISISNSALIFNFSFSSSILPRKIEWLIFWNEKEGLIVGKKLVPLAISWQYFAAAI